MSLETARWLNVRERERFVVLLSEEFGFASYWWWPALGPAELEGWWRAIRNGSGSGGAPYFFGPGGWPWPKRRVQGAEEAARWQAQWTSGVFYTAHAHWDDDSWLRAPDGRTILHDEHPDRVARAREEAVEAVAGLFSAPIVSGDALRVLVARAEAVLRQHEVGWAEVAAQQRVRLCVAGVAGAGALLAGWGGLCMVEELDVSGCGLVDAQVVAMWAQLEVCNVLYMNENPALSMAALRPLREDLALAPELYYVALPDALDGDGAEGDPALEALRAARPAAYFGRA